GDERGDCQAAARRVSGNCQAARRKALIQEPPQRRDAVLDRGGEGGLRCEAVIDEQDCRPGRPRNFSCQRTVSVWRPHDIAATVQIQDRTPFLDTRLTEPFGGAVCDRHFFHPNVVCSLERYFFHAFTALFERDLGAGRQGFFP